MVALIANRRLADRRHYKPLARVCVGVMNAHDGADPKVYVVGLTPRSMVLCNGCVSAIRVVAPVRDDLRQRERRR